MRVTPLSDRILTQKHLNLPSYTFVALDLETTGLSQEKDTIIEVAAVKFQLERLDNTFHPINVEERSMLIDPERAIDDHISMITGISDEMVKGRSKWHEVRERVSAFIGDDSIILGHNVLFDVNMLSSHGIHLGKHRILDTFELSEIFSLDVESLNLWFLAKRYGFDDGSEHRALDDTKLSMNLFFYYLWELAKIWEPYISLWQYARSKDESMQIDTLLSLIWNQAKSESWNHSLLESREKILVEQTASSKSGSTLFKSLSPIWDDEKNIITQAAQEGKVLLLTSSKKQTLWLSEKLSPEFTLSTLRERSSYISVKMISAWLEKPKWKRKETILIIRLIHWLLETKTSCLDELKWYGEENSYRFLFQLGSDEETYFTERERKFQNDAKILITEQYNRDLKDWPVVSSIHTCIIRDVCELEKWLRYRDSKVIDFATLEEHIEKIGCITEEEKKDIHFALWVISEILTSVVPRPTGPNPIPPWEFGETYFFTQKELWHRGYIWLIWASEKLELFHREQSRRINNLNFIDEVILLQIRETIQDLVSLANIGNSEISLILEIKNQKIKLTLIPRHQKKKIQELLEKQWWNTTILTGYNIRVLPVQNFLKNECWLEMDLQNMQSKTVKVSQLSDEPVISWEKIVILWTNLKILRWLSAWLKQKYSDYEIFTQGISWGKAKMLQLFLRNKKSLLIWLIDTWKDESSLLEKTDILNITKIPFDPPSDPTYLARTVGMSNNFELYSIPLAIHTINTLIGRAKSANSDIDIFLCDEKLTTMNWGKNIVQELL
jgi:DNA polymerase III epsilon subunit family exonuclease